MIASSTRRGVESERLSERQGLRRSGRDQPDPGVRGQLQGARLADDVARDHRPAADRVEDRLRLLQQSRRPGRQDHERAVLGGLLRAEHGRVDDLPTGGLGDASRTVGTDRAGLDPHRVGIQRADDLPGDGEHGVGVEEHGDHGVTPGHGLGDRPGGGDPVAGDGLRPGGGAVPDHHLVALPRQ